MTRLSSGRTTPDFYSIFSPLVVADARAEGACIIAGVPFVERVLSPAWVRALLLGLLSLALSASLYEIVLTSYPITQGGDGPFFHRLVEAGKVSIGRYHELPLWNAYECGGVPLWDNPQSVVAAPLMLLMQPLNTTVTMRVWYIVHHALGFVGMWLFARHELRVSRGAALAASVIFALTAAHGGQYAGGHAALVAFLYAPLALLLWRRAENDTRFAVGLGLLFAWMFYEGAVYPVPHIGLVLAAEALTRLWPKDRLWRVLRAGAIFAITFVAAGAARILPVVDQLRHHTRDLGTETDALRWQTLVDMFLSRTHGYQNPWQQYVWPEFIAYLGVGVMALALVGLLFTRAEEAWFAALALFVFLLMLGHFAELAPWHILKGHIFPWKSMRVPSRFRLILLLFIAGWVAMAVDRLPPFVSRWLGARIGVATRLAVLGVALLGAGNAMSFATQVVASRFDGPPAQPVRPSTHLYIGGPEMAQFIDQPRQNRGRLDCWEEWNFTAGAPQWQGDVPQARSNDPNVVVEVANRTQNTFTIDAEAKAPGKILVNVPYDRGWRTDVGTVVDEAKLLVVEVPEGRHRIHLQYWPHGLTIGFLLTGVGLALSIAYLVFATRRRRA
jgi:hypothetical protein